MEPSTPEEPTSVIQIMDDFDSFSRGRTSRRQLSRSRSGRVSALDSFQFSKEKEIELISSKAKVTKLENQLKNLETERKRLRIEDERDALISKRKCMKKDDESQELQKQLKYLLDKEEQAREEITDLKKMVHALQEKYENDSDSWSREKKLYAEQLAEVKENARVKIAELRERLDMQEVYHYKNRAELSEKQLALAQSKLSKLSNLIKENTDLMTKLTAVEQRCRDAEEALSSKNEASVVAKAMYGQITKYKEIERKNDKLTEENKLLRDSRENSILLQEKYESMKEKHNKALEKLKNLCHLEIENEELKKKLTRWEIEDSTDGTKRARSPSELTRMVSDLQKNQLSMTEKHGDLLASVTIKNDSLKNLTEKNKEIKQQLLEIQANEKLQIEKCNRLQRKLVWVTTERDGLRRVLNSYDTETASNYSPQLLNRVKEAEDRVIDYNDFVDKMESDLDQSQNELGKYRLLYAKLQEEIEELKSKPMSFEIPKNSEEISQLKNQIDEMQKINKQLQENADMLEALSEQRNIQISQKLHAEQFDRLKDENIKMQEKLRRLRESGIDIESIESTEKTRTDDKELEELKAQLKTSELQKTRLKEAFRERAKTVRESIYHLFGYNHDMTSDDKYQILSMYAASPDDKFLFKKSPQGEIQMLSNRFSSEFPDQIKNYLQRGQSIPAFLSSVTLELFSRQTVLQDTTLSNARK